MQEENMQVQEWQVHHEMWLQNELSQWVCLQWELQ
jgi:hypothetical protein